MIAEVLDWFGSIFDSTQSWLFMNAVEPLLYKIGLVGYDEMIFDGLAWFLYGVLQIVILLAVLQPLEYFLPAEEWDGHYGVGTDVFYTLLNRLGLLSLLFFVVLTPLTNRLEESLRMHNFLPGNIESMFPALLTYPLASFLIYLVILDFFDYWRHRWQHRLSRWWELHAVHHSQQHMTFWTDDRNSLLDEAIRYLIFSFIALLIGVPPGQFVALVIVGRLVESLSHANVRWGFGAIGNRILVSPQFHRIHHAIDLGPGGSKWGCNFATLLPVWDVLFGTANFREGFPKTGIDDQLTGRDYGKTIVEQQWLALRRFVLRRS